MQANDNKAFEGNWEHMELEGGGVLSVCAVPDDAQLSHGQALICTDDPDAFELTTFRDALERWRSLEPGEQVQAFVHPADLADFKGSAR